MLSPDEPDSAQVALLVQQAQWITERHERNAEGFMNRAGMLLGLIGVEAAVVASAPIPIQPRVVALTLLTATALVFLVVLRPSRTLYPSHLQLVDAVLGGRNPTWLILEQSLKVLDPESSLASQFKAEAEQRASWHRWGLYAFMSVQPFIVVVIVIGAMR
ncbi:MAG: hypothetical protein ACKOW5_09820 [Actinomycetales bacterium]